jgi:hypothetical protein
MLSSSINEDSSPVTETMTSVTTSTCFTDTSNENKSTSTSIETIEGKESTGRFRRQGRLQVLRQGRLAGREGQSQRAMVIRTGTTTGPKSPGQPLLRVSTVPENALSQTLRRRQASLSQKTEVPLPRRQLPKATNSMDRSRTTIITSSSSNEKQWQLPRRLRQLPSPKNSFDRNRSNVSSLLQRSTKPTSLFLQKLSDHASSTFHSASTTLRLRPEEPSAVNAASDDATQDTLLIAAEHFAYSQQDIVSILRDREAFETLKISLRQRSCVTNTYLKLNVHFFVQHVKQVRLARHQHFLQETTTAATTEASPRMTISMAAA